jgi:tetratricopeptide (TPR) repeat protein
LLLVVAGIVAGEMAVPAAAQQWTWPERAENLTELPEDFPPERLSAVMRGFSQALGVRCSHCHVGEEGQPLSTFDFVSDANPNKDRARAMYRMLGVVNDHLGEIEPSGAERVNMWCHTCHAGKPRPWTLGEAVHDRYRREGGAAAWTYYQELRSRYFGAAAYDFRAGSVDAVGEAIQAAGDTTTAYRFFEHNLDAWPSDGQALERMGDVWLARGDTAAARSHWERSLEAQPGNPRIRAKLERTSGR